MRRAQDIERFVSDNLNELIEHRRWFHAHPEISFQELGTSAYIQSYLKGLRAGNFRSVAKTGIVFELGEHGPTHAARFNMDGLPIGEKTGLSFSSSHDGSSHSCGHDFELAWGLMVAKYFVSNPVSGCLRLIFQPAEEGPGSEPHGKTGGQLLHELDEFKAESIMSLHVEPDLPLGMVSIAEGEVTCSAYDFEYVLKGKTSHAAKPQHGINPVPVAADLTHALVDLEFRLRAQVASEEDLFSSRCQTSQHSFVPVRRAMRQASIPSQSWPSCAE